MSRWQRYWRSVGRRIRRSCRRISPYKRMRYAKIITYSSNIVLGVCCIAWPEEMYHFLPYLMGAMMLLSGAIYFVQGVRWKEYKTSNTSSTAQGLVSLVMGVLIMAMGSASDGLIGVFWGIGGLQRGIGELNHGISLLTNHEKGWARLFFMAAFGIVISILLLIDPLTRVEEHMIYIGIELLFIGIDEVREMYLEEHPDASIFD